VADGSGSGGLTGGLKSLLAWRLESQRTAGLGGPNPTMARLQDPFWQFLCDYYFRLELDGWQRLPNEPSLLVGVHSGGALTMDAWTLVHAWWQRFGETRTLNATAHDVLMAAPLLGDYFRMTGVIAATGKGVATALESGHDVVIWPGGEQDAMRSWRKRDQAVLAGRKGFVKMAIRTGVPIVPVATVGGHDTVFVLTEGRFLARVTGLGDKLRGATAPLVLGFPFGITPEILPTHLPLPAKIRTELLEPIRVDADEKRLQDPDYIDGVYREVESAIQSGMDRLASRRRFPVFG
jgi:1-acyl-sn-glycerol-3-phosphate acyltransferase